MSTSIFDLSADKLDYLPGEYAIFTATGTIVGGVLELQVQHVSGPGADGVYGTLDDVLDAGMDGVFGTADDGSGTTGEGHDPFYITDGGVGDLDGVVNGSIQASWYVNPDDSLGETFLATAKGVDVGADGIAGTSDDSYLPGVVAIRYRP